MMNENNILQGECLFPTPDVSLHLEGTPLVWYSWTLCPSAPSTPLKVERGETYVLYNRGIINWNFSALKPLYFTWKWADSRKHNSSVLFQAQSTLSVPLCWETTWVRCCRTQNYVDESITFWPLVLRIRFAFTLSNIFQFKFVQE